MKEPSMAVTSGRRPTSRSGRAPSSNGHVAFVAARADRRDALYQVFVGAIQIVAGIAVARKPRYGAYLVAGWLAGVGLNLLTAPGFYDVALRDFGLVLAAFTLVRLASNQPPMHHGRS
jgi:hypothetical protein